MGLSVICSFSAELFPFFVSGLIAGSIIGREFAARLRGELVSGIPQHLHTLAIPGVVLSVEGDKCRADFLP